MEGKEKREDIGQRRIEGKRERGSIGENNAVSVAEKCHGGSIVKRYTSHFEDGLFHLSTHSFPTG